MIEIKDRVPKYPNRKKITKENGQVEYATVEYADEPTEKGTPINMKLFQDMYNDIVPVGMIKPFCNIQNRNKFLLCDGSSVFNVDYPKLAPKLPKYTFYKATNQETKPLFFVNDRFIGKNESDGAGVYRYSFDCQTWTKFTLPDTVTGIYSVLYANGTYYFGTYTKIYYTTDFSTFNYSTPGYDHYVYYMVYGNGYYMCVVYDRLYYSTDGKTWTFIAEDFYNGVIYDEARKRFLAIYTSSGDKKLYAFTNGNTQTLVLDLDANSVPGGGLQYYNGTIWIGMGGYTPHYSTNGGSSFTLLKDFSGLSSEGVLQPVGVTVNELGIFTYGAGATKTENLNLLYSTDNTPNTNKTWLKNIVEGSDYIHSAPIFGNGLLVATNGNGSTVIYSTNDLYKSQLPVMIDETNQIYGYIKAEED